jgi:hypothetical protein
MLTKEEYEVMIRDANYFSGERWTKIDKDGEIFR